MRARRFQAQTLAEAYERVRESLGDEAVILSTRNAVGPGLLGLGCREYVEVVAALPEELEQAGETVPLGQYLAAHDFVRQVAESTARDGSVATDASLVAQGAEAAAPMPLDPELAPPFMNPLAGSARAEAAALGGGTDPGWPTEDEVQDVPPSGGGASLDEIAEELGELRGLMERFAHERLRAQIEEGPAALREARARLEAQEVGSALMLRVLDRVMSALAPDASEEAARQVVLRRLVAELPPPLLLDLTRAPATVFIVGPTGAGKTTAAVRLGLQLAAERNVRVTLAGIDVDRVGAPQELEAYGAATGLPVRLCYTPGELQALLGEPGTDVVLVDTPGDSGARRERMAELQAFARAVRPRSTLLTVPATMRSSDAQRLATAYRALAPDGLLITRCDETETFGGLLTIACEEELGVAFTTHSPSVRDAARPGDAHALASAVMLGRWTAAPAMTMARAR